MRILQIIPGADSFRVFLRELTQALLDEGHEVLTLFNPGGGISNQAVDGPGAIQHLDLPRGAHPLSHIRSGRQIRKVIQEFRPDVIHAHFSSAILTTSIARLGGHCGARWMATFQGIQFPYTTGLRGQLIRFSETFAASRFDEVFVLTEDDREALAEAAPAANIRLQQASGFGCQDRFLDTPRPDVDARAAFRASLELPRDATIFIYIGRMVAHKGFHLAARAFMAAAEANTQLRWIVIGERDPIHSTGLTDEEWTRFQKHPAVRFVGIQDDVLPYLDVADAMLFPTAREGMPVSVMESLARRVPVLTNPVRGCRELVRPGQNGAFFEAPSVEAIRQTIEAFTPALATPPDPVIRRSHWIRESIERYKNA